MLSRLRCNNVLYAQPDVSQPGQRGRRRKYGKRLGSVTDRAAEVRQKAKAYTVNLYGKRREVCAYDEVVMLKTLKRSVRVVWVFRKTQWVAMLSTDLELSVKQIIEYYGARWKIESGFKELKQDIGSRTSQCRNASNSEHYENPTEWTPTLVYVEHTLSSPSWLESAAFRYQVG
ncbi:MAG: transposase [Methylococcales bacterium]|nr:transposase [Methylococcales bacterium]MDD5630851.1 transposase [Methylococcales bacterium]